MSTPQKVVLSRQIARLEKISPELGDFARQIRNTLNALIDQVNSQSSGSSTGKA